MNLGGNHIQTITPGMMDVTGIPLGISNVN
jgi:hypothetical protein